MTNTSTSNINNNNNLSFFEKLELRVLKINSLLCIGLDPHVNELQGEKTVEDVFHFCENLIQQTLPYAVCYKPNAAFFEAFGAEGIAVLKRVIQLIPQDIPVLLDAKRGDIFTTAEAYAMAAFDELGANGITLNPYMGYDSIAPFVKYSHAGCFLLCKTSNPSSDDLQTQPLQLNNNNNNNNDNNLMLYEQIACLSNQWNTALPKNMIGLVVGATDTIAMSNVRKHCSQMWLLTPGIGAQGGSLEEACRSGLTEEGTGLLVPISRGISKADNPAEAAKQFRDLLNVQREVKKQEKSSTKGTTTETTIVKKKLEQYQEDFIKFALERQVLRFGSFTLKSGRLSPYFFNAGLFNTGLAIAKLGNYYAECIVKSGVEFDILFGPAYKGIPLATAVGSALALNYGIDIGVAYNRKEAKDHGEGGVLVGASMEGKKCLIIDDVITAGTAIREAMQILKSANAECAGVIIALDRQEKGPNGATQSAVQSVVEEFNIPVLNIIGLYELMSYLMNDKNMSGQDPEVLKNVINYKETYGVEV